MRDLRRRGPDTREVHVQRVPRDAEGQQHRGQEGGGGATTPPPCFDRRLVLQRGLRVDEHGVLARAHDVLVVQVRRAERREEREEGAGPVAVSAYLVEAGHGRCDDVLLPAVRRARQDGGQAQTAPVLEPGVERPGRRAERGVDGQRPRLVDRAAASLPVQGDDAPTSVVGVTCADADTRELVVGRKTGTKQGGPVDVGSVEHLVEEHEAGSGRPGQQLVEDGVAPRHVRLEGGVADALLEASVGRVAAGVDRHPRADAELVEEGDERATRELRELLKEVARRLLQERSGPHSRSGPGVGAGAPEAREQAREVADEGDQTAPVEGAEGHPSALERGLYDRVGVRANLARCDHACLVLLCSGGGRRGRPRRHATGTPATAHDVLSRRSCTWSSGRGPGRSGS